MAGDWIKIESVMPDKPEVGVMAEELGIDHDAVVGKLVRFWIWADQQSVDGNALSVTQALLDRVTFCTGFTLAMEKIGWLVREKDGFTIPNFTVHNGKSAKKRALTNDRVKRKRNALSVTNALPEKRREEKNLTTTPPLPPPPKPSSVPEKKEPEPEPEPEPEYRHLSKAFFRKIELLFDDQIVFAWRGHQTRLLKDQVERLGEETVLRVIREAAKGIGGPGVNDRATYLLRIVERYDPAVAAAQDEHWGRVKCVCGKTHKILMPIQQRKIYWSVRGEELAIKCGCGESVLTGKRVPQSYDVTELRDMPTAVEKALSV